jgi:hypothetical protein
MEKKQKRKYIGVLFLIKDRVERKQWKEGLRELNRTFKRFRRGRKGKKENKSMLLCGGYRYVKELRPVQVWVIVFGNSQCS